ncbi:hypothetical protein GPROT1_02109 [Gammaproteobacteria bacterium]|nr:hypothetical protein GPROT1_02109 [Gammaproteobacteria bacterium]
MDVPSASHPMWGNIVSGKARFEFEFLATKLILRHLTFQVKQNPSPDTVLRCAQELRNVFARNLSLSCVQRDLIQIFGGGSLSSEMHEVAEVKTMLARGKRLLLAGEETLLKQLPAGNWIGGSIPYFMTEQGGLTTQYMIHVTELPDFISEVSVKVYDAATLASVYTDMPANGFSVIIIPAFCATHLDFALHAPEYQGFAIRPLIGWISGVHLNEMGKLPPKVFNGQTKTMLEDGAVVMHVTLPADKVAEVGILNIFEQSDGDTITFPQSGFSVHEAHVNGVPTNFAEYLTKNRLDTDLPLVADYFGAMVNVSFEHVDLANREVKLYAPVFAGVSYKHARPVDNYVEQFTSRIPDHLDKAPAFSCNCILNYVYSELEGKRTGDITGPITFGEVAYQLLNQTMVYLTITDAATT